VDDRARLLGPVRNRRFRKIQSAPKPVETSIGKLEARPTD